MKNKAMEAMLLSKKPKKKFEGAKKLKPSPIPTIDTPAPTPIGPADKLGSLPVPSANKLKGSDIESALSASKIPVENLAPKPKLEGDVFLGPTEVTQPGYSPIQNYLKKKKGEL
jgi:hypothetical protein